MTDDAKIVRDILNDNWDTDNVAKPALYYKDDVKNHDYRNPAIKCYLRSMGPRLNKGITHIHQQITAGITIDIRSPDRDSMLALRDEVIRCLNVIKEHPDDNYDLLLYDGERQVSGYVGFWHYVVEITLKNNARLVVT